MTDGMIYKRNRAQMYRYKIDKLRKQLWDSREDRLEWVARELDFIIEIDDLVYGGDDSDNVQE